MGRKEIVVPDSLAGLAYRIDKVIAETFPGDGLGVFVKLSSKSPKIPRRCSDEGSRATDGYWTQTETSTTRSLLALPR